MDDLESGPAEGQLTPPTRRSLRARLKGYGWTIALLFVVIIALANAFIQLPYYIFSPGRATAISQYVSVPSEEANPHKGDVFLLTVSQKRAHPLDFLWLWTQKGIDVEKQKKVIGTFTPQEYLDLNFKAMDQSKMTAIEVALTRTGHPVSVLGDGAGVQQVTDNSPSSGKVNPGDIITAVNGTTISLSSDLSKVVAPLAPGTPVQLTLKAQDGAVRTETITAAARPDGSPGSYIGVVITTANARLNTPFPVELNTTQIGGPSAGLAFTLALIDELTPGELTGGGDIAVTGTISPDGSVGPVGGVKQKTIAVNRTDATLFLVPSDEYDEAVKNADKDVKVVKVDTLDQALAAIAAHGGNVPTLSSGTTVTTAP